MDISQLWRFDSSGIQDPSEQKTKEEPHKASIENFLRTVKEWKREGIIEEVPKEELKSVSHYLPHRHVGKPNSTTKIRPVFNASSKQKEAVSLNNCLEKVLNLIELIPSSPTENSLAVLNRKILEANSQVQNVKLGGHQTCLSINRLWHELCDMLRRLVGTTAPGHHDCSIQE
ncbi:integrase catalytic domain-containing protein [Trichonephila clavipes]|nr:integrase catalytic domain-containing protein [Trichonephila clavipes]